MDTFFDALQGGDFNFQDLADELSEFALKSWLDDPDACLQFDNRQDICRFLGISESTYSGWVKKKKLPRYASVAMGLAFFVGILNARLLQEMEERKRAFPINMGDTWGVVRMKEDTTGELIASGIPNYDSAELIANGLLSTQQLKEMTMEVGLDYGIDGSYPIVDDEYADRVLTLLSNILHTTLKDDPDILEWKKQWDPK